MRGDLSVLCVDPDDAARRELVDALQAGDVDPIPATSLADAERTLQDRAIDCVVTEYELPDGVGFDLVDRVRSVAPDANCILFTDADRETIRSASPEGVIVDYIDRDLEGGLDRLGELVRSTAALHSQTAYPLPEDEDDRLVTLSAFDFDSEALESSVERITDLAAAHFDVPLSSINIITEHSQEFLTCFGADWSATQREDSVCTYTILEPESVNVIEDLAEDPRFEHNESIQELGLRFYAGANIVTSAGHPLGSLCVYDHEPRSISSDDEQFLQTLAAVTADLLELHQGEHVPDDAEMVPGDPAP